ncbi:MAG TPA: hypothetical protein VMQ81_02905, partial [Acidimicrobiia bacterium]|nr:hypothetical protein [Acidimicrobiia bacterium]
GMARIVRIDPATNSVTWDAAVDVDPAALAATSDAVWVLDTGTEDAVVRLDPSNGEEQARLDVGPFFMGSIAAAGDSIWVAGYEEPGSNQGTILRIDPATATVTATIDVEGFEPGELAAGSQGLYALGIRRDPETTGSAGGGIVRIDPVGGEIVARADIPEDEELAVSDDGVFVVGLISPILRLDPVTLEVIESTRREVHTMTAAPPGTWGDTARGVTAFDVALDPVVTVPVTSVTGALELAAGFGSVWMLEGRLGVVVRIRAGA